MGENFYISFYSFFSSIPSSKRKLFYKNPLPNSIYCIYNIVCDCVYVTTICCLNKYYKSNLVDSYDCAGGLVDSYDTQKTQIDRHNSRKTRVDGYDTQKTLVDSYVTKESHVNNYDARKTLVDAYNSEKTPWTHTAQIRP